MFTPCTACHVQGRLSVVVSSEPLLLTEGTRSARAFGSLELFVCFGDLNMLQPSLPSPWLLLRPTPRSVLKTDLYAGLESQLHNWVVLIGLLLSDPCLSVVLSSFYYL